MKFTWSFSFWSYCVFINYKFWLLNKVIWLNVLNYWAQGKGRASVWCHYSEGVGLTKIMLSRAGHMKKRTEKHPKSLSKVSLGSVVVAYFTKSGLWHWNILSKGQKCSGHVLFLHVQLLSSQCTMPWFKGDSINTPFKESPLKIGNKDCKKLL